MSEISIAQKIAFGKYINDQVFPEDSKSKLKHQCPFRTGAEDEQRFAEKTRKYDRIKVTVENSKDFLKTIASWRKDKNLALGGNFDKDLGDRIEKDNYNLEQVLGMVFRQVQSNIQTLFRNPTLLKPVEGEASLESVLEDPQSVQGGMLNALSTQLGWTFTTLQKTAGKSVIDISKILNNNKKALRAFLEPQFSLFNMVLNEFGVQTMPFLSFNKLDKAKFELVDLKSAPILLPKEEVLRDVIANAKQEDAHALMHSGSVRQSPKLYLKNSSMPIGCPAAEISMEPVRAPHDHEMKSTLASEFMEYLDVVVKQKILPRLDKIEVDNDHNKQ